MCLYKVSILLFVQGVFIVIMIVNSHQVTALSLYVSMQSIVTKMFFSRALIVLVIYGMLAFCSKLQGSNVNRLAQQTLITHRTDDFF